MFYEIYTGHLPLASKKHYSKQKMMPILESVMNVKNLPCTYEGILMNVILMKLSCIFM